MDLGSVLGTKLEPCWPPFSLQDAPRGFQDAPRTPTKRPKTPPRHPKTPQDAPRPPQDAPRTPPRRPKAPPDNDVGTILRRFWKTFGRVLEGFFGRFCHQICLLFWRIFGLPRFFACGFSCNARPPCSRSAGSIRRASLRASSRVRALATWLYRNIHSL